jgi:N-acetylneuraminate synthase/N,N'-diacetyllegionaminate synthase
VKNPLTARPDFAREFRIGSRSVGPGHPTFVIAEAGVSHFGDMDLALRLVEMARAAAADAFKIQVFDVDALIAERAPEWRERLRPRNLGLDEVRSLNKMCVEAGMAFILTIHDETRIPWVAELGLDAVKVGSGERSNPAFLERLAGLGRPMIVSTGMSGEADVAEAIAAVGRGGQDRLAILHCVSSYPTPDGDVNLRAMDRLRELFPGPVGYSDHTPDGLAVLSAVARGASLIEKHITILRDVPNAQDWKVSATPENFPGLVRDIRRVESLLGSGRKEPAASERGAIQWALKSLVAARDLRAGEVVAAGDLAAKRPGDGMQPNRAAELIGKQLVRDVRRDEPFAPADVR